MSRSWRARYASPADRRVLEALGISDLGSALRAGAVVCASRHVGKEVARLEPSRGGGVTLYLKRQLRRRRPLPRTRDLFSLRPYRTEPEWEWRGLRRLRSLGFETARPVALLWHPWRAVGVVVTEEVEGARSLDALIASGRLSSAEDPRARALLDAVADVVLRLEGFRLRWKGLAAKHLLVRELDGGAWRVTLIDCEGLRRGRSRRILRQRETLFADLARVGLPECHLRSLRRRLEAADGRRLGEPGRLGKLVASVSTLLLASPPWRDTP